MDGYPSPPKTLIARTAAGERESAPACRLCGLPSDPNVFLESESGQVYFCCPGCLYVFEILRNSPGGVPEDCRDTELFKACVAAGLIPSGQPPRPASRDPVPDGRQDIRQGLSREFSFKIEGMWCIACSRLLERLLSQMDGVVSADIFFFSDMARIRYMPHRIEPPAFMEAVARLGYRAVPLEEARQDSQSDRLSIRLGIATILTMNVMIISFAVYYGLFENLSRAAGLVITCSLWALATPVVFYCGLPIMRRAFLSASHRDWTMDTLIAASVLSAYSYSVLAIFRGSLHVYFDTASMLVTLVLLGRFIELRARDRIAAGITALFQASAQSKARLLREGARVWVDAEEVRVGDRFLVRPGERAPVDGYIVSGNCVLDESMITGESRPVQKQAGADVPAGGLLLHGDAEIEALRPGSQSSLSQIATLVQEALSKKNNLELLADRAMRILAPSILLCAAALAIFLLVFSAPPEQALLRALTVLVITCPCALGIATPLARVALIARAKASGILIRNSTSLERAGQLQAIVFDKTGTITRGKYGLLEIAAPGGEEQALRRVATAESRSGHFLAREIVRAARERGIEPGEVLSFEALEGKGVAARTPEGTVIVGNRSLLLERHLRLPETLDARARRAESQGATVVFFGWNGLARGYLAFGDMVRETAREIISTLRRAGITPWIVSGDSLHTTAAVARELGVENFVGQALPQDKAEIIRDLQEKGLRVAMVGDGLNDGAPLARADIGISVGPGANLVRECSDAAIFGDDLRKIDELLTLSRFTVTIIRQNLFFAFFYNLLAIPVAAAGMLNPLIAALAMFASSATVISNTLRISSSYRKRFPKVD